MKSVFSACPDTAALARRTAGLRGGLWVWFPAILGCFVIALESTRTMGANNTSTWLRPIFEGIFGHLPDDRWGEIHHLIRKTGHFCGYGTVCWTFLRGWLLTLARRASLTRLMWRLRSCALAVLSTAVVASCDEWHQTFLPNRTGQIADALLDTCGALVLCALVWLICWRRRASKWLRR
jgi:VanZ family protein